MSRTDRDGAMWPGVTHAYRDGHLIATYPGRVLVARDNPAASLLYDDRRRVARALGGGPWRDFSPCPDPYNHLVYELSPDGRRGLCLSEFSHSDELVVFDVGAPRRTRRVAFRTSLMNRPYIAGWLDNERIATLEHRAGVCPFHRTYGVIPAGLAVIDVRGKVLERGPCLAGVLAGPRGVIYVQQTVDYREPRTWFPLVFGSPVEHTVFSTDGGRGWHSGRPQFATADGRVYYLSELAPTLYDEAGRPVRRGVLDAAWSRTVGRLPATP